ncbi:MAG: hypothetical protein P8N25_04240 [Alphaproteobacteria bacterium]|nr:hypothetical protein [Alphaproteobacteria bacterium]
MIKIEFIKELERDNDGVAISFKVEEDGKIFNRDIDLNIASDYIEQESWQKENSKDIFEKIKPLIENYLKDNLEKLRENRIIALITYKETSQGDIKIADLSSRPL